MDDLNENNVAFIQIGENLNIYVKERVCSKCEETSTKDTYIDYVLVPIHLIRTHRGAENIIARTCNNCGFTWSEKARDSTEKTSLKDIFHEG